jgi:hypothetical protein
MWLQNLYRRCLGRPASRAAARPSATRRRGRQLFLERLDDRIVPSNFTAASVSDLIAAVNTANQTPEADTITLVAGKTFTLTTVTNTTDGVNGLPVIAAGENLTIIGNGDVIERSTAKGTPAFRLFDVAVGASLTLENLTLQGGLALGSGVSAQGGAIYSQGTLSLHGVTIQNNTARGNDGGTVWGWALPGGNAEGGGIYSSGGLSVESSTIQNNVAIGGRGGDGGVVYRADGPPRPTSGGPGGNGFGGGLYAASGALTLHDTSVTGNTANGGSGGNGAHGQPRGATGKGVGGGLYIDLPASVGLDAFTVSHVKKNHASTSDDDIHGSYEVIP